MLPTNNILRQTFNRWQHSTIQEEKEALIRFLKDQIRPGRIDVNIMTKVDRDNHTKTGELIADSSDALAALRGYANSELTNSAVIFSAGLNPRLFSYL